MRKARPKAPASVNISAVSCGIAEKYVDAVILLAIAAYMALQLAIGVWISRRIVSESDYLLAGRKLGFGLATFSIFATWFGAETIVGSAGRAYREGVSLGSAEPFGYGLCIALMGLIFAAPLYRRGLTTLADLYRQRYSVGAERLAAIILIPSSVLWAAAQIRGFGYILSVSSGNLTADAAVAIAAGFTIMYTAFGGLLADATNDLIQGLVVVVGLVILFVAVLPHAGGFDAVTAALADPARARAMPEGESMLAILERWAIPVAGSVLATELIGRVLGAKSVSVAKHSAYAAAAIYVAVGCIPLAIGLIGPQLVPGLADPEQLMAHVARDVLPTALYVVFAGALISAILSTVDSTLLVASALLSHNIVVPVLKIGDEARKVRVARLGVLAFGAIAYVLALHAEGVFELVEQASAFGSAGTLVTVCFGLFTSWGDARAAIATLAVGMLSYLGANAAGVTAPFLTSLLASLVTYMLVASLGRSAEAYRPTPTA
jgi:Na+/proline symporter